MSLLTVAMFLTTTIFSFITASLYPEWTWLPQTPMQALLEGVVVVMMFQCVIMMRLDKVVKDE